MKNSYSNVINEYVKKMKEELNENLSMLLIIGSSSSDKVMENWSDIDVILVVKKYNFELIEKIKKIVKVFPIKIGTTIYTETEFFEKKIDPKTYYHIFLLQKGEIELQYKRNGFIIPKITFDEIKQTHTPYLYWRLHTYKRMFLYDELSKEQYRVLFKTTYLIMKAKLILSGELPKNYDDVFKLYSKKFAIEYFNYEKFINDYLKDNKDYELIYIYAQNFLLSITE